MGLNNPFMTLKRLVILPAGQTPVLVDTPYTMFEGEDVELLAIRWSHTNTNPRAQTADVIVTIDGEVFTAIGVNPNSGDITMHSFSAVGQPLGTNWFLDEHPATESIGLGLVMDVAGFITGISGMISGREVTIELRMTDVPGTAQRFDMDIYYHQIELG